MESLKLEEAYYQLQNLYPRHVKNEKRSFDTEEKKIKEKKIFQQ